MAKKTEPQYLWELELLVDDREVFVKIGDERGVAMYDREIERAYKNYAKWCKKYGKSPRPLDQVMVSSYGQIYGGI